MFLSFLLLPAVFSLAVAGDNAGGWPYRNGQEGYALRLPGGIKKSLSKTREKREASWDFLPYDYVNFRPVEPGEGPFELGLGVHWNSRGLDPRSFADAKDTGDRSGAAMGKGLLGGIGPGITGVGAKIGLMVSGIGTAMAALPALAGVIGLNGLKVAKPSQTVGPGDRIIQFVHARNQHWSPAGSKLESSHGPPEFDHDPPPRRLARPSARRRPRCRWQAGPSRC